MEKIYDASKIQSVYYKSFEYDLSGEFHALKVGIITTHLCTLKCKLCAERTSQYKERYNPTIEYLKKEVDALFEIFDFILKFEITGGEPLVRKDLAELLDYLVQYKKKFGRIRLLSNGTIIPNDEVVDAIKKFGKQADVLVDDYGVDKSINAAEAVKKWSINGISCIHRKQDQDNLHCGGWVDFGDLSLKNSSEEAETLFSKCFVPSKIGGGVCVGRDGLISTCRVVEQCRYFGVVDNPDEYLSVFDSTSVEEKRNKLMGLFDKKYYSACRYCNGFCQDSERFVPAEQI